MQFWDLFLDGLKTNDIKKFYDFAENGFRHIWW